MYNVTDMHSWQQSNKVVPIVLQYVKTEMSSLDKTVNLQGRGSFLPLRSQALTVATPVKAYGSVQAPTKERKCPNLAWSVHKTSMFDQQDFLLTSISKHTLYVSYESI